MTKTLIIAACLFATLCWLSPAGAGDMPGADAAQLWAYITKASPYKSWKQWPDYQGRLKSHSPHGVTNQVFANPKIMSAKGPPMPAGSIQVKDAFDKGGKLENISVMYKLPGYNPKGGDWYWALYTPAGKVITAGKPRGCVSCHGVGAATDYVLVHTFK